ncbi:hypothetical protein DDI_1953 [Dickeya dianthicola RNS04.9]|nr:hypothetical protein DDI_1953 [Dickeya dianthicola RNS04.9]
MLIKNQNFFLSINSKVRDFILILHNELSDRVSHGAVAMKPAS